MHSDVSIRTSLSTVYEQNTYLHRLDERDQSKRPEAAKKGEQGKAKVIFSRRAGAGLQRDKITKYMNYHR